MHVCVLVAGFVMALSAATPTAAIDVSGVVRDSSGAPVRAAEVGLLTPELTGIARTKTDAEGKFSLPAPAPGTYLLVVRAEAFGESHHAVTVGAQAPPPLDIVIHPAALQEEVTVTALRGIVEDIRLAGQPVNIIDESEIATRVKTVVAQALEGEAGVHLQRTSPTMAGIFVRGLTGNKVNIFVDGVRYSNGAQRGGVNTFLDLIEPEWLETIEVLRGPSSAQYGSDALGGSVQFLSRAPALGVAGGPEWRGSMGVDGGTAHRSAGGNAFVAYMGRAVGLTASIGGRKAGGFRPGKGIDSHAAVTRFFGIASNVLMDERLPDTGFEQYGASVRSNWVPDSRTHIAASYMRTNQDRGKRYDQLLGGDGNLISDLNDLSLDLFSARLERLGAGWFDDASVIYSLNSQREERVNQGGNGNPTATIGHEPERTTVHGVQAAVGKALSSRQSVRVGADANFETLTSDAFNVNPVNGAITPRRPRIPDHARFAQAGVYAQTTIDVRPDRLRLVGALRYGGARYTADAADSPVVNGQPLWPDDSLSTSSATFRASAVVTPSDPWTVLVSVSRGFRAPHMTDLGTLGLTGSGFEVAAPDVAGLGGTVGTTADATAVSTGDSVTQVGPETSLQYEGSLRYRRPRFRTELSLFVNNVYDNIQKQALILPQGAAGTSLGGTPITSQNANGAVFVAATTVPVLVRANFDNARIWGIEHSAETRVVDTVTLATAFTYLRAKDRGTGLSPNIEGGTPAPEAWLSVRWMRPDGRVWVEPYAHVAWEQTHLSSLDLGDRRTGSSRSRASIRAFFLNGAHARNWISAGADNVFGTADDLLTATGDTLAQIQDRVLGAGVNSSSLFPTIPGYATFGVRVSFRAGRHQVTIDAENLGDENYRGISWGMDAPGRGISVKYATRF
jgi:outer membrane receptor protein involved in Fe transport